LVHQLITIAEDIGSNDTVWSVFDQRLEAALFTVEMAISIKLRIEMGNGMELIRWLEGWNLRFKQQKKTLVSIIEDPAQQQCLELSHPSMELVYTSSVNEIPKILLRLTQQHISADDPPVSSVSGKTNSDDFSKILPASVDQPDTLASSETGAINGISTLAAESKTVLSDKAHESQAPATSTSFGIDPPKGGFTDQNSLIRPETTIPVPEKSMTGYECTLENSKRIVQNTTIKISGEYQCNNCGVTRMFCKGDIADRCENRECISDQTSFTLLFDLF
jgi:hypothetical protein